MCQGCPLLQAAGHAHGPMTLSNDGESDAKAGSDASSNGCLSDKPLADRAGRKHSASRNTSLGPDRKQQKRDGGGDDGANTCDDCTAGSSYQPQVPELGAEGTPAAQLTTKALKRHDSIAIDHEETCRTRQKTQTSPPFRNHASRFTFLQRAHGDKCLAGPSVDAWLTPLQGGAEDVRKFAGVQARPLVIASDCTGTNAGALALSYMGFTYEDLQGSDPKRAAQVFMKHNAAPLHLFDDMRGGPCKLHPPEMCCRQQIAAKKKDIYISGFTCQPNSILRWERFAGDDTTNAASSYKNHKTYYTAEVAVASLAKGGYEFGVLENVGAAAWLSKTDDMAPVENINVLINNTKKYVHRCFTLDHEIWVNMKRLRKVHLQTSWH